MSEKSKKAQSILEYAILILIFAAVVVGASVYLTRLVQARFRQSADVFGEGEQYDKRLTQQQTRTSTLHFDDPPPVTLDCESTARLIAGLEYEINDAPYGYNLMDYTQDPPVLQERVTSNGLRGLAEEHRRQAAAIEERAAYLEGQMRNDISIGDQAVMLREAGRALREEADRIENVDIASREARIEELREFQAANCN